MSKRSHAKVITEQPDPTKIIQIDIGRQGDGGVYELHPLSKLQIKELYPNLNPPPVVLLGYDKKEDFVKIHSPLWPQVAMILTGLTIEQIEELGGVRIYDPRNEEEIWRHTAEAPKKAKKKA